jgi:hypothetical protein
MKRIGFYKKNGSWYADLPEFIAQGGTEAACVMVAGADTLIEKLSLDGKRLDIEVDMDNPTHAIKLDSITNVDQQFLDENNHPFVEYGGNYTVVMGEHTGHKLWLCPVCKWVFGEYPQIIPFNVIMNESPESNFI